VDLEGGELRKSGLRQKLTGQPFEVLRLLLEHPQQVVTREELQKHLWPADTFVDYDLALKKAINRIREVLGDDAESPRFIETIPRRGYRFIAPLNANGDAAGAIQAPAGEVPQPPRRWRFALLWGIGASALVVAVLGVMSGKLSRRGWAAGAAPEIRSLAVVPLQNLSADPAQEYFSDGMTDALITDLAQIGSLRVISRTSSMRYKQTKKSLPEIARELTVDGIVEGTVQRSGDRVRITAQLIHGPSDKHFWAASYERDVRDVFGLEREIAGDVAHQVQARLRIQNQVALPARSGPEQPRPVNLKALEAYLQGHYHLRKAALGGPDQEIRMAGEYFQQAIDADPNFALAYVGLAEAHHGLWWPSSEDFTIMKGAAQKAVDLDPTSSEARAEVALSKWDDWDWSGAEEEYRKAITLNPNNAFAHDQFGDCLDAMGRLAEGWKEKEIAQQLDPKQDHLSDPLYRREDYDRSIELLRKTIETRPEDATLHWALSLDYAGKRMQKEWLQEFGKSATLFGWPEMGSHVQRAFATSGYRGAMRQWAKELERLAATKQGYIPGPMALAYAALGDKDRAFYWLEQGVDHRHLAGGDSVLPFVKVDPMLAPLRSDPRFADLVRRMGLPP
jgi:TolB-like protein/DNA-binding winged helix-turn-helix (wHTH) protein